MFVFVCFLRNSFSHSKAKAKKEKVILQQQTSHDMTLYQNNGSYKLTMVEQLTKKKHMRQFAVTVHGGYRISLSVQVQCGECIH